MTSAFTPITGTLGGSLIGLSASILLLGNGDILGASGIVSSFLKHPIKTAWNVQSRWKVVFLSSFLVTSVVYFRYMDSSWMMILPKENSTTVTVSMLGYTLAGFLVGLGTKLSNGCTSGHGICGLARCSPRSLVAVLTFMTTGVLTGSFTSSSSYFRTTSDSLPMINETSTLIGTSIVGLVSALCLPMILSSPSSSLQQQKETTTSLHRSKRSLVAILSGSLFSLGLGLSGMVQNLKVLNFLNVTKMMQGSWDGTLMTVMGSGLLVSMLGYQFVHKHSVIFPQDFVLKRPMSCHDCDGFTSIPTNRVIDLPLLVGAALFGTGWGLAGVCPGPALFLAAIGVSPILKYWWPSYYVGTSLGDLIKKCM